MRRLRHLRSSRSRQHDLPRAVRAAAPRAGERRHRRVRRQQVRISTAMGYVADTFDATDAVAAARVDRRSATCATRRPARASCSNAQPILIDCAHGQIAICHNGNLVNAGELRDELVRQGSIFQSSSDTEVILHLYARSKARQRRGRHRRIGVAGAGRVLVRDADAGSPDRRSRSARLPAARARPARRRVRRLLGNVRDGPDRRDLRARRRAWRGADHLGRRRALDQAVPARRRSRTASSSTSISRVPTATCSARASTRCAPSSGRVLAREQPVDADVVVPVPDSGVCAAMGYAESLGHPAAHGADPQSLRRAARSFSRSRRFATSA